jgi:hypothetical protein
MTLVFCVVGFRGKASGSIDGIVEKAEFVLKMEG